MAASAGAAGFGEVERRAHVRVLCAACGCRFVAHDTAPGGSARCTTCGASVRIADRVVRRRLIASSSNSLAYWADDGRTDGSDALLRGLIYLVVVVGGLFALVQACSPDEPQPRFGVHVVDEHDPWEPPTERALAPK